jgi:hypothetical protein
LSQRGKKKLREAKERTTSISASLGISWASLSSKVSAGMIGALGAETTAIVAGTVGAIAVGLGFDLL